MALLPKLLETMLAELANKGVQVDDPNASGDVVQLGGDGGARPNSGARASSAMHNGLTKPAVNISGKTQYFNSPEQAAVAGSSALPSADAMMGPDVLSPSPTSQAPIPSQIQQPSFAEANTQGAQSGVGPIMNPALTTKGKVLATILGIATSGAAGWAAGQKGNPREGYGGAAAGFAAGSQLPFIQAYQKQQLEKGMMDNYLTKAELDNLPYQRAAALAKQRKDQADAKRAAYQNTKNGVYNTDTGQYEPGSQTPEKPDNLDQMIASRMQDVTRAGGDPAQDKQLQQLIQTKQSLGPPKPEKVDAPEQQFTDEYQRRNKGATIQQAQRAYAQNQHITDPAAANTRNDARSDKSYQFNVGELNSIGKPITDRVTRLGTLQDTINQTTPQADALIAPELLTVMAGGQGSGLRMNEAEIARIVGGRTAWESIKAAANKWQTDPSKGLSVTPAQRGQIRALIGAVYGKLQAKQNILDQAQQDLIGTDDPTEHRRIVARTRQQMTTVDQGQGAAAGGSHPLDKFWKK
jgi:hypothetical protein